MPANTRFKVGDRVIRPWDVYVPNSPLMRGKVIRVYSRPETIYEDFTLGPYPELYAVEWDHGKIDEAFLPHGLAPEGDK